MKKIIYLFLLTISSLAAFAQLDTDKDGVPDSEDACPMDPGSKSNKGCPVANTSITNNNAATIKIKKAKITNKGRVYTTIANTNCLDWGWATAEQKSKASEDNWDGYIVKNGDVGEVIFKTKHCSTGISMVILKIGNNYVPMDEEGISYMEESASQYTNSSEFLDSRPASSTNEKKSNDLDKYKSNIDIMNSGTTPTAPEKNYQDYGSSTLDRRPGSSANDGADKSAKISTEKNTNPLKKNVANAMGELNKYLETFDNGYYGYFEIKDGYVWLRFKQGKFNKFKMEDMEGAVIQEQYNRVIFKCKGKKNCIETNWKQDGREEYTQFVTNGNFNYQELADLLNNFRDEVIGKKSAKHSTAKKKKKDDDDLVDEDFDGMEKTAVDLKKSVDNAKQKAADKEKNTEQSLFDDSESIINTTDKTQATQTATNNSKSPNIPGCFNVLENTGCVELLGKTRTAVESIIGKADSYGDYFRYGVHLWYNEYDRLENLTFYGMKPSKTDTKYQLYNGDPGRGIKWRDSPEEVVKKMGAPKEKSGFTSDYVYLEYNYPDGIKFWFFDNQLGSIVLNGPHIKHSQFSQPGAANNKNTESFCTSLSSIFEASTNSFKDVRSNPEYKSTFGYWKYSTSLPGLDFSSVQLESKSEMGSNIDFSGKSSSNNYLTYVATDFAEKKTTAVERYNTLVKSIEKCGTVVSKNTKGSPGDIDKDKSTQGSSSMLLLLKSNGRTKTVELEISYVGDDEDTPYMIELRIADLQSVFKKDN